MEEMKQIASPGVAMDVKTGKVITTEGAVGLLQKQSYPSAKDLDIKNSQGQQQLGLGQQNWHKLSSFFLIMVPFILANFLATLYFVFYV